MSKSDQFINTPVSNIPSNSFDLSHNLMTTVDAGYFIPVMCQEAIPGDRFKYNNTALVRLQPMLSPAYTKLKVTTITGFIPMRLIWENSGKFFANPVPDDNTPVPPHFTNVRVDVGDLGDYLGLPTRYVYDEDSGGTFRQYGGEPLRTSEPSILADNPNNPLDWVSALPFAAYQRFFNDWLRDENLYNGGDDVKNELSDGINPFNQFNILRKRAWRHDYFTSALPFAQKGDPVEIPIGSFTNVPVEYSNSQQAAALWRTATGSNMPPATPTVNFAGSNNPVASNYGSMEAGGQPGAYDPNGTLIARTDQLTQATAVTINTLRWAEKLQVFLEKNARGGTRYTEIVRQHFGVRSSDARLQRAEFLGFSVNPITVSEVLQTTPGQETALGDMAGHGISYGGSKFVNYFAEEHGFFMTFINIRPDTTYFQGLSRMWWRKDPLAYAWPTFAQLGEQEVKNKELYYGTDPELNEATFGYLPRYAEYRYAEDRLSGEFRTSYAYWHMARIFKNTPALNEDFISCTPTKRIFAVTLSGSMPYMININHNLSVRRALPKYSIPAL